MKKVLLSIIILLIMCPFLFSSSISTSFTEVLLENLEPGKKYSLKKIANYPYNIKNKGSRRIKVRIQPVKTQTGSLKKKFKSIPDKSWVKLKPDIVELNPGEEKYSDIIITIPDDEKYYGKKYQVSILSETINKGGFSIGLALESFFFFTTVKKGVKVNEMKSLINLNYEIKPSNYYITNIKINNSHKLIKKNYELNIFSKGSNNIKLKIKVIKVSDTLDQCRRGYKDIPDLSIIKLKKDIIKLNKGEESKIRFEVHLPDMEHFKGKKYQFIIYISTDDEKDSSGKYTKVFMNL